MEWITNQTSGISVANVLKTIWNGKENFGFNSCVIILFSFHIPQLNFTGEPPTPGADCKADGPGVMNKTLHYFRPKRPRSIPNFRPKGVKGSSCTAYKTEYSTPPSGQWGRVRVQGTDLV